MAVAQISVVLLCITLLLTCLLQMPGGVLRKAKNLEAKMQSIYDSESELLLYLNGLPASGISATAKGPWLEISSPAKEWGQVNILAALPNQELSRLQKRTFVEHFRTSLDREILLAKNLQIKSGNRRIIGPARDSSLLVENGDLLVDVSGPAAICNFKSAGSITVKGAAVFDTLRLYSGGPMLLAGDLQIKWLEAFSADQLEVAGNVRFSGALMANNQVVLSHHALAEFPSTLISLNASLSYEQKNVADSLLLPAGEENAGGRLVPISWSLE